MNKCSEREGKGVERTDDLPELLSVPSRILPNRRFRFDGNGDSRLRSMRTSQRSERIRGGRDEEEDNRDAIVVNSTPRLSANIHRQRLQTW